MKHLASRTNPIIKDAFKRCKTSEDTIIVEGEKLFIEALNSGFTPEFIFLSEESQISIARKFNDILYTVPKTIIKDLTELQSNVQLIAFFKTKADIHLENAIKNTKLLLILDRLQDPGNIGNIIRTAEAMGVDTIALLKSSCLKRNRKLIRAAMGSFFRVQIFDNVEPEEIIKLCKASHIDIIGTQMKGKNLFNFIFPEKCAIVLGQEGKGIAYYILNNCNTLLSIPMQGELDSLNVASSAAICLYEWAKQNNNRTINK